MKIIGANVTGSFILNSQDVTTTIQTSNVWSGSVATDITALNASTASLNAATASLLNYTSSNNAAISDILLETASFNAFSSSILNYTSSTTTAIADILLETASINLLTASLLSYTSSQNNRNGTYATTGSNTFTGVQTVNSNLVVTGSITAQTLIVQTITSSQDFVTGSTKFGSLAINTHQFTGSVIVTGSLNATAFTGSGAGLTSIPNAALTNSTISGIALGSNLATLTIGTGLSGTSYNGSGAVTIANTITNNNQLTNGAGYITSAGTAAAINQTITAGSEGNLVFATIGTNDFFRIRAGGGSNAGFVEIATADDGTEPIYVRQYTGEFASLTRTATLLDGSGNTSFPGSLSATNLSGTNTGDQTNISGNAATATTATSATTATNVASPDGDRNPSTKLPTTNARNVRFDFSGAGAVGGTGNYAGVMTYAPWDGTSASTGDSSYQLAFLNETGVNASGVPGLSLRNGINSTWNAWYRIITSGNIGSQTVASAGNATTAGGLAVHTGRNNEANKIVRTQENGYVFFGYINSNSGNENNNSNADRVWGTNGSDDYLRTYRTSALSVSYAATAGSAGALTTAQNVVFSNGRKGLVGVYDPTQTQAVFAMGAAYVLTDGGGSATYGPLYGLGWSYNPDYAGAGNNPQSKAGLNHQLLHMQNGVTTTAIGSGIWTGGSITATGDITAYYSDMRLKTKISNIDNALDKVMKLNGFYYINNDIAKEYGYTSDKVQIGVSAQEIEAVLPEIVTLAPFDATGADAENPLSKSGEHYKTVKYEKIVPLLIEAIKEQQTQIEELKSIINGLTK